MLGALTIRVIGITYSQKNHSNERHNMLMDAEDAGYVEIPWTSKQSKALERLYAKFKAVTIEQRIAAQLGVQGECNVSSAKGEITRRQLLRALEILWLEERGLIRLQYL